MSTPAVVGEGAAHVGGVVDDSVAEALMGENVARCSAVVLLARLRVPIKEAN